MNSSIKNIKLILFFSFLFGYFTDASSISNPSSSTSNGVNTLYESFSTSMLPTIHFFKGNKPLFDYIVQVGENKQQIGLRLDLVQGDVWLPAASAFQNCNATTTKETTTLNLGLSYSHTSLQTTFQTLITKTQDSSVTVFTSTIEATSINVNMVDSVFVESCAIFGVYNLIDSLYSSFYDIYSQLTVSLGNAIYSSSIYISEIFVSGFWAIDSFTLAYGYGKQVETIELFDVPFVYSNFSNVGVGSLALGSSQTNYSFSNNFISNFVINNLIKTNSYSLALGNHQKSDPILLLGGVDLNLINTNNNESLVDKQSMALFDFIPVLDQSKKIVPINDGLTNSIPVFPIFGWGVTSNSTGESITFSSSYNDRIEVSNYPKPAVIDSRHYYNYIPYSTLVEMAIELNAYYSDDIDRWIVDCSVGDTGTIDMYLGGEYVVNIPISNFFLPATFNNTNLAFASGDDACFLAFLPDYRIGYSLMGTPLLKNIYLAVDNENKKLAISPLNSQLDLFDIDINTEIKSETQIQTDKSSEVTTIQSHAKKDFTDYKSNISTELIDRSVSTLSSNDITYKITKTFTVTHPSTTYLTTSATTYTNNQNITYTTKTHSYFAIESGTIPYAKKFTTVENMTLTIVTSAVFTDTLNQSMEVYISDGEVYLNTNPGLGQTTKEHSYNSQHSKSIETDIYAFSSLVSSISSATLKAAGSNLQIPSFYKSGNEFTSLNVFSILFAFIFVSITML